MLSKISVLLIVLSIILPFVKSGVTFRRTFRLRNAIKTIDDKYRYTNGSKLKNCISCLESRERNLRDSIDRQAFTTSIGKMRGKLPHSPNNV